MSFSAIRAYNSSLFHVLLLGLILFCYVNGQNVSENVIVDDDNVDAKVKPVHYRLPNNTKPESYDITLITNIHEKEFSFSGRVAIKLVVLEASHNITIHARQLNIKTIDLSTISGTAIKLNPFTYDNVTEFLVIPTQSELQKDTIYVLTVEYAGELRPPCDGFYRTSYTNSKGETKKV